MPLVVVTGFPSSGKTTVALQRLKVFLRCEAIYKNVKHFLSYSALSGFLVSSDFTDSSKEKEIRGLIKAEAQRLIGRDTVVIIDAGNYIKGYRYELYCMSKSNKCTQCTLHCVVPVDSARQWNAARVEEDAYSQEVFDALIMRYESPDSRNRWDIPLFSLLPDVMLPGPEVFTALFERKAPPPNMSTQCAPLSSTNFLYELDSITQEIVTAILSAQKLGVEGQVKIPGHEGCVLEGVGSGITPVQLARLRRQFLSYTKLHPMNDTTKIPALFTQFLNTSLR
ncbi:hypothetical protein PR048_030506 [Dryococelus australis]|uniref:Protein KTI12 homolog n=1 Tax=Dryococelus australis TaxID=614101 RepID=A0ABQ9G962_9NEOP|nr:hypothetical protein PR048_030506 [Dryococelus australis]